MNLARREDIFFIFEWVVTALEVDFDGGISKFERRGKEIHQKAFIALRHILNVISMEH